MTPDLTARELTVVLVEDSDADARLLLERLHEAFRTVHVHRARTLEEGCATVAREDHDVVVLDLGLPDCTGLEACTEMMSATIAPVVVVTGFDDEPTAQAAVTMGAQDYLVKDELTSRVLRRALRYAIERQRAVVAAHGPGGPRPIDSRPLVDLPGFWLG